MSVTECHIFGYDIVYKKVPLKGRQRERKKYLKALVGSPLEGEI